MNKFDLYGQINKELNEFFNDRIKIAGVTSENLQKGVGFEFSQWETINAIELYYNSKFESGELDSEGQRKVFFNICAVKADVASKQVDLDVKDFVFVPDEIGSEWGAFFLNRKFRQWAKKNYFGQLINEVVMDLPKYGSAVIKRAGDKLERIPLKTLRIDQSARNLQEAKFVIQEHNDWTYNMLEAMKEWDLSDVDVKWDEKFTIYERYGRVPLDWFKEQKGLEKEDGDDKKSINTMAIVMPVTAGKKKDGKILFLEEIDYKPFEEVHWKQIDGRWLGVGEIENQFENQIFRNMITNLRRRGLLWSSKKIFQSTDTELSKNLVRDVKDGQILKIMPNGQITQVNTTNQSLAEFQQAANEIDSNSNEKAFTYEVATGESLPSGTPFRLGVIMSNAVNAHFAMKRENLGLFFERVVYELLFPIFKKENKKAETMLIPMGEEGVNELMEEVIKIEKWKNFKKVLLSGKLPNLETIDAEVREKVKAKKQIAINLPERLWDTLKVSTQLVITGEGINVEKRLETLTNLYNVILPTNPEMAEKILSKIMALTGENYDIFSGISKSQTGNPMLEGLPQQNVGGQLPQESKSDALMEQVTNQPE